MAEKIIEMRTGLRSESREECTRLLDRFPYCQLTGRDGLIRGEERFIDGGVTEVWVESKRDFDRLIEELILL